MNSFRVPLNQQYQGCSIKDIIRIKIYAFATMMGELDPDLTLSLLNIHEPQVNSFSFYHSVTDHYKT